MNDNDPWTLADQEQAEALAAENNARRKHNDRRAALAACGLTLHDDGTITRTGPEPLPSGRPKRKLPPGLSWTKVMFRRGGR
jgi:hypothetical protein